MRISILDTFSEKLDHQVEYIAQDKPAAARKFKKDVIAKIRGLKNNPFKCRKSFYSENENIRDLIFKGYVITFLVDLNTNTIVVFALYKYEENPPSP